MSWRLKRWSTMTSWWKAEFSRSSLLVPVRFESLVGSNMKSPSAQKLLEIYNQTQTKIDSLFLKKKGGHEREGNKRQRYKKKWNKKTADDIVESHFPDSWFTTTIMVRIWLEQKKARTEKTTLLHLVICKVFALLFYSFWLHKPRCKMRMENERERKRGNKEGELKLRKQRTRRDKKEDRFHDMNVHIQIRHARETRTAASSFQWKPKSLFISKLWSCKLFKSGIIVAASSNIGNLF